jgi:hypothetical protein
MLDSGAYTKTLEPVSVNETIVALIQEVAEAGRDRPPSSIAVPEDWCDRGVAALAKENDKEGQREQPVARHPQRYISPYDLIVQKNAKFLGRGGYHRIWFIASRGIAIADGYKSHQIAVQCLRPQFNRPHNPWASVFRARIEQSPGPV